MSRRRDRTPQIPPFIDFYGRPTFENPAGQYRPNPALTAPAQPAANEEPTVIAQANPVAATGTAHAAKQVQRDEASLRAELAEALVQHQLRMARATGTARPNAPAVTAVEEARSAPRAQRGAEARARMRRRVRRTAVALLAVIGVLGTSTTAYAYFTSHGSGSGSGTGNTASVSPVTVTATGTVTTNLLPGGTADLHLVITNPNSFQVKVTSVTQNGPVTNNKTGSGCTNDTGTWPSLTLGNSGVSVSASQPPSPVTITSISGASQTIDLAAGASMGASSNTGCQGATFTIPVSVTVQTP